MWSVCSNVRASHTGLSSDQRLGRLLVLHQRHSGYQLSCWCRQEEEGWRWANSYALYMSHFANFSWWMHKAHENLTHEQQQRDMWIKHLHWGTQIYLLTVFHGIATREASLCMHYRSYTSVILDQCCVLMYMRACVCAHSYWMYIFVYADMPPRVCLIVCVGGWGGVSVALKSHHTDGLLR